jgi:ferredoxin--NADP+ reductase
MTESGPIGNVAGAAATGTAAAAAPPRWTMAHLTSIHRWTDPLMTFCISRPAEFRFTPGHYARLGLADDAEAIEWRPYSIVSSPDDRHLEFLAVLVPSGTFSDRLARARVGDPIRIEKAAYGFLTVNQMAPGQDLWLLASGTGLGPFVGILRDRSVWQAFDRIIVAHSVRRSAELAYRADIERMADTAAGAGLRARLRYVPVVTREALPGALSARIPQLIEDGTLEAVTGIALDREHSRVMVCGNPELVKTLRALLSGRGFQVSRRGAPGQMAFEKYW